MSTRGLSADLTQKEVSRVERARVTQSAFGRLGVISTRISKINHFSRARFTSPAVGKPGRSPTQVSGSGVAGKNHDQRLAHVLHHKPVESRSHRVFRDGAAVEFGPAGIQVVAHTPL